MRDNTPKLCADCGAIKPATSFELTWNRAGRKPYCRHCGRLHAGTRKVGSPRSEHSPLWIAEQHSVSMKIANRLSRIRRDRSLGEDAFTVLLNAAKRNRDIQLKRATPRGKHVGGLAALGMKRWRGVTLHHEHAVAKVQRNLCAVCGEPTAKEVCRTCRVMAQLEKAESLKRNIGRIA